MASNIVAGLDGIRRGLEPPAPVEADPYAAEAPRLPGSLSEAVAALDADLFFRSAFGETMVNYLVMMKRAEVRRYEEAQAIVAAGAAGGGVGMEGPAGSAGCGEPLRSATGRCGSTSSSSSGSYRSRSTLYQVVGSAGTGWKS